MSIADKVRERAQSIGLNQAELAKRSGISRPTVHRLLSGKAEFTPEWAIRIGHVIGSDPRKILKEQAVEQCEQVSQSIDYNELNPPSGKLFE